jgi:hypothetical protein
MVRVKGDEGSADAGADTAAPAIAAAEPVVAGSAAAPCGVGAGRAMTIRCLVDRDVAAWRRVSDRAIERCERPMREMRRTAPIGRVIIPSNAPGKERADAASPKGNVLPINAKLATRRIPRRMQPSIPTVAPGRPRLLHGYNGPRRFRVPKPAIRCTTPVAWMTLWRGLRGSDHRTTPSLGAGASRKEYLCPHHQRPTPRPRRSCTI